MSVNVDARVFHDPWWMQHASCKGRPHLFFPPQGERPSARERREAQARTLCAACPVQSSCRDYARMHRELGFWGAESEIERAEAGFPPSTPVIGLRRYRASQPESKSA